MKPASEGVFTGQVYGAGITVTPPGDTHRVSTQLRLVEPPEPRPQATRRPSKGAAKATTRRGRVTTAGRRSASGGDWRLDAGTRQVGRAGVASARRALEAALESSFEQGLRAS